MDKSSVETDLKNVVWHGNCLELMADIPDGSVDMILCDLPYGTTACSWDTIIPFEPLWYHYKRIIKPNGAIVLTASQPFTSKLVMSNVDMFKYEWIYKKNYFSNQMLAKCQPLKIHENVVVFSKERHNYNPQGLRKCDVVTRQGEKITDNMGGGKRSKSYHQESSNYPRSIQQFKRDSKQFHPTQKPVALFEYLIKTYTDKGDLVLDNCAGSGTTGEACIKTDRDYILIEQEQKYIDIINKRIDDATRQGRLF